MEDDGEKIKIKMKSFWNNVKYKCSMKARASLKNGSPVFLLGHCYHPQTDAWRWHGNQVAGDHLLHRKIIRLFGDNFSSESPFSIHSLVRLGIRLGKSPGDWYGPASVAQTLKEAMDRAHDTLHILEDVTVYVANNGTICLERLRQLQQPNFKGSSFMDQRSRTESCFQNSSTCYVPANNQFLHDFLPHSVANKCWFYPPRIATVSQGGFAFSQDLAESHLMPSYKACAHYDCSIENRMLSDKYNCKLSMSHMMDLGLDDNVVKCHDSSTNRLSSVRSRPYGCTNSSVQNDRLYSSHTASHDPMEVSAENSIKARTDLLRNDRQDDNRRCVGEDASTDTCQPHHHDCCRKGILDRVSRAVIILVPLHLGVEGMNEIYVPCLKSMLASDFCIGIVGGRCRRSLYFIGWQGNKLLYLDPHYCQNMVNTSSDYFPMQLVVPPLQKRQYPLFVVSEGDSNELGHDTPSQRREELQACRISRDDAGGRNSECPLVRNSDGFVVL